MLKPSTHLCGQGCGKWHSRLYHPAPRQYLLPNRCCDEEPCIQPAALLRSKVRRELKFGRNQRSHLASPTQSSHFPFHVSAYILLHDLPAGGGVAIAC